MVWFGGKTLGEAILTGLVDPISKEIKKGLGMVMLLARPPRLIDPHDFRGATCLRVFA